MYWNGWWYLRWLNKFVVQPADTGLEHNLQTAVLTLITRPVSSAGKPKWSQALLFVFGFGIIWWYSNVCWWTLLRAAALDVPYKKKENLKLMLSGFRKTITVEDLFIIWNYEIWKDPKSGKENFSKFVNFWKFSKVFFFLFVFFSVCCCNVQPLK